MTINRRRAASSKVSSDKKKDGHRNESVYAQLIEGKVIKGTQKGDVRDQLDFLHSVKTGKKWQVFLYGHERILDSKYLKILEPCLDAFPLDSHLYFQDRIRCIEFKEDFIKKHGREAARELSNSKVSKAIGNNEYVNSKNRLASATSLVRDQLKNRIFLRNFLAESLFNNDEVSYLAVKDSTFLADDVYKTFDREDVLNIFSDAMFPEISQAGNVPEDFNVAAQKTLLKYSPRESSSKNVVEIEIRNDSATHYRQVRFNMYSKDALFLLINGLKRFPIAKPVEGLELYGKAASKQN